MRAMKAAETAYQQGASERRVQLRETYLHTLRAFNTYAAAKVPVRPAVLRDRAMDESPAAARKRSEAMLSLCGLD